MTGNTSHMVEMAAQRPTSPFAAKGSQTRNDNDCHKNKDSDQNGEQDLRP